MSRTRTSLLSPFGGFFVAACALLAAVSAHAQTNPPSGTYTLNQAMGAAALTPSDATNLVPTRGVYIGDAAACNIAVIFRNNTAAVTLANVQPGLAYPFSIKKLMSTNTTCTAISALY